MPRPANDAWPPPTTSGVDDVGHRDPDHPPEPAETTGPAGPEGPDDSALESFIDGAVAGAVDPAELARDQVTAVLVAHKGNRWGAGALDALAQPSPAPEQVVGVDTDSTDGTTDALVERLGSPAAGRAQAGTGFGAAVPHGLHLADQQPRRSARAAMHRGVAPAPLSDQIAAAGQRDSDASTQWVWLLHDDCAPDPDALLRLLECAVREPDAAVIGPKVRSWSAPRQLLEVGFTVTGGGRRQTGLERREFDQGQHDVVREVLAVGSAGMLVRRDVWDELTGFDPHLELFRDDLDFGWRANLAGHRVLVCPDAVVYHAEAAAHGRRRLGVTRRRPHLVDRRNALFALLVNAAASALVFVGLRLLIGGVGRSLGYLFGKQPALAAEELVATLAVLLRPDRIFAARRRRAPLRRRSAGELRHLFPAKGHQVRNAVETVYGLLQGTGTGTDIATSRRRAAGEEQEETLVADDPWLMRFFTRPSVLLVIGALVLTLFAARGLFGSGQLAGGALLPAPTDVGALWRTYTEAWHGVGLGSPTAAPPYLGVVALLGTLFTSPSVAVDVLLLGSVPLSALTATMLLRRVVVSRWVRVWAAAAYAVLPAISGAIAAGRLGTAVACVVTPLIVLAAHRSLGAPARADVPAQPGTFRTAWTAGLLIAVAAAFVPLTWVLAVVLGVAAVPVYRTKAVVWRGVGALVVTPVVLLPWTFEVVRSPVKLLSEAGIPGPGLSDSDLGPGMVALLHPGGPGVAPLGLAAGLVLAGFAGLLLATRRGPVVAAWGVGLLGLAAGVVLIRVPITGPTLESPVAGWPGYATVVIAGALIVATALAADDRVTLAESRPRGLWRPLFALLGLAAMSMPVLGGLWWAVRGAEDPLERRDPAVLPIYVAEQATSPEHIRTLVLDRDEEQRVSYALLREAGPRLASAETGPPVGSDEPLAELVGELASGLGTASGAEVAAFGARYIYLPAPFDVGLADALDAVPGIVRASPPEGAAMWRVEDGAARVRVLPPDSPEVTGEPADQTDTGTGAGADADDGAEDDAFTAPWTVLPSGPVDVDTSVPEGDDGRVVVLAERTDPGWSASLDRTELEPVTVGGWAQGFELPASAGNLVITHEGEARAWWLRAQAVLVVIAVILAMPAMRRSGGVVDDVADLDPEDTAPVGPPRTPETAPGARARPADSGPRERRRPVVGRRRPEPYRGKRARGKEDR